MFIMERQRKFSLRKLAGYGLISCAIGLMFIGGVQQVDADQQKIINSGSEVVDETQWEFIGKGYYMENNGLETQVYNPSGDNADFERLSKDFDLRFPGRILDLEDGTFGRDIIYNKYADENKDGKVVTRSRELSVDKKLYQIYKNKVTGEKLRVFDEDGQHLQHASAYKVDGYTLAYVLLPFDINPRISEEDYMKIINEKMVFLNQDMTNDFAIPSFSTRKLLATIDVSKYVTTENLNLSGSYQDQQIIERLDLSNIATDKYLKENGLYSGSGLLLYVPTSMIQPQEFTDRAMFNHVFHYVNVNTSNEIQEQTLLGYSLSRQVSSQGIGQWDEGMPMLNGTDIIAIPTWLKDTKNGVEYDIYRNTYTVPNIKDYEFVGVVDNQGRVINSKDGNYGIEFTIDEYLKSQDANNSHLTTEYTLQYRKVIQRENEQKDVKRIIRLHEGNQLIDNITQKVQFSRENIIDLKTGNVTYGDWKSTNPNWSEYIVPKRENMLATQEKVLQETVTSDSTDKIIDIYYKPFTVDGSSQTDNPPTSDSSTQTDNPTTSDNGTQTDNPDTTDTGTQTKVEIPVTYQYEDGTVYKSFTIIEDKGYIVDGSDLEMLPDNMDFVDDFVTYEVKGDGTDSIVRIVKKNVVDQGSQTDNETKDDGTQTDNPNTTETGTQTKVEIPVTYQYEDGTVYKSFTIIEDKGYIVDGSDLEMLPDNMDFVDDFVTYEVKGDGTDSIVRIVKKNVVDQGSQTDNETKDDGTQTDNPNTTEIGTQTKVEIPVTYQFEDGIVYKSFTITEDKGYIVDGSDLEMLPDNMDFADDFVTYEVKGDGTDSIVRIVKKNVVDQGSQTDNPSTNDGSTQTDNPTTTSDNGTQTDNPDTGINDGGNQIDNPGTKDDSTQTEPGNGDGDSDNKDDGKQDNPKSEPGEPSNKPDAVVPIDKEPIETEPVQPNKNNKHNQSKSNISCSTIETHLPKMPKAQLPKAGTKNELTGMLGLIMIGVTSIGTFVRNKLRKE